MGGVTVYTKKERKQKGEYHFSLSLSLCDGVGKVVEKPSGGGKKKGRFSRKTWMREKPMRKRRGRLPRLFVSWEGQQRNLLDSDQEEVSAIQGGLNAQIQLRTIWRQFRKR